MRRAVEGGGLRTDIVIPGDCTWRRRPGILNPVSYVKSYPALLLLSAVWLNAASPLLDLAPYGVRSSGTENARDAAIEWREVHDIHEVRVRFAGTPPADLELQYWAHTWPGPAPQANRIEDPADDPWQGAWLTAQTARDCTAGGCRFAFQPLASAENPRAGNMPGVRYRRTLKIRIASLQPLPAIASFSAFSDAVQKPLSVRIGLGYREKTRVEWSGSIAVDNGILRLARPWGFDSGDRFQSPAKWTLVSSEAGKGLLLDLIAAAPTLPGSLDCTLVTVRATAGGESRTFTFNVDDLKGGPIYVPAFHAWVTDGAQREFRPAAGKGPSIRSLISQEPEQTYERAAREIAAPNPWENNKGKPIYMPLAADSSWQKFAFEYGGNVFIGKDETKAMGRERARLKWDGNQITWRLGSGSKPYYREDRKAMVSLLDGYLPVISQAWDNDGLAYSEEAFATLLRGPLSPDDPARSEQTPAILMLRITAVNRGASEHAAHLWLDTQPGEVLTLEGTRLYGAGHLLRALFDPAGGPAPSLDSNRAHVSFPVAPGSHRSVVVKLPFVSDLSAADEAELDRLPYDAERARVTAYWQEIVGPLSRFSTPERNLNLFARAVPWHIRMSTTKDPASGLYMVPAASYRYKVYANESAFQVQLLDALGDHRTAAAYLETFLKLQGSAGFPGMHRGMENAIFHGVRVNADYDYTAHRYGLDHPTILWTLGEHYLYTRDKDWLLRVWPQMDKAIGWIEQQRESTPDRLLPACHLEDNEDWASWFSINGLAWAGVDRAARALEDIRHPDAARIRRQADAFRADLRAAVLHSAEQAPVTQLRDGTYAPYVPAEPNQRMRRFGALGAAYYKRFGPIGEPMMRLASIREVLYGPIILLNVGLFDVNEPIADWVLNDWEDNVTLTSGFGLNVHGLTDDRLWFSQGGMVFQCNLQNPVLVYLKRGEIPAAIRGMYNNLVALFYPDANALAEEFHEWGHGSGPLYKIPDEAKWVNRLRDSLVLEDGSSLYLARGVPRRWLASKEGVRADALPTYFGPVTYTLHSGAAGRTIEASVKIPQRNPAKSVWLVVRAPEGHIREVTIDGKPWTDIDLAQEAIRLPGGASTLEIRIRY